MPFVEPSSNGRGTSLDRGTDVEVEGMEGRQTRITLTAGTGFRRRKPPETVLLPAFTEFPPVARVCTAIGSYVRLPLRPILAFCPLPPKTPTPFTHRPIFSSGSSPKVLIRLFNCFVR